VTKRIAFASYTPENPEWESHYEDEKLLRDPLAQRGIQVDTVAWTDEHADWSQYDAVIIRSVWDYYHHYPAFLAWLNSLEQRLVRVLNPYHTLRWNMDKVYLSQMQDHGIRIMPTVFVPQGQSADLDAIIQEHGWSRGVVKPTVSGGGDNTWRFTPAEARAKQADFDAQIAHMPLMIQQYAENIAEGEWSFLFFNGIYSHTAHKIPAQGDMFVHAHRGGSTHSAQPDPALIGKAAHVVRVAQDITGELPLYARVDAVLDGDEMILMELEVVEPYLYMPYGDAYTTQRMADAIAQRV
jgi:glutathione synthase/RimK-type ligase-like ATP-grasp enzyme